MKYSRILRAVADQVWAIEPAKGRAMLEFLAFQASGGKYTPAEIRGQIGDDETQQIAERRGGVAVIPLMGVMSQRMGMLDAISGGTSTDMVGGWFDEALEDEDVKAIILHVDSPGGNIYGVEELGNKIYEARGVKPVIAQVNSVAASAAFWDATQAEELVVTPGGDVGSIGVYTVHEDISRMLEAEGVTETIISAGKYKVEANPFEPLSEEAAAYLQSRVDEAYERFVATVARGREKDEDQVRNGFGQGRMVGAKDALAMGMVDRVATLDETIKRFTRPAGNRSGGSGPSARRMALNAKAKV